MKKAQETIHLNSIVSMYKKPVLGEEVPKELIMALSVDKEKQKDGFYYGIARTITQRKGSQDVPGFVDHSKLIVVRSKNLLDWEDYSDLQIHKIQEGIKSIPQQDKEFIGLEDPDIIRDKDLLHVYFTIAFKLKQSEGYHVCLGHAQGLGLEDLTATKPLLSPILEKGFWGFKESTIYKNFLLNETLTDNKVDTSLVSLSKIKDLSKPFEFQKILLDPREINYSWCAGHLSPCTILPERFIKYKNMLVGIVNGREKTKTIRNNRVYGKFRPGLILFNPKTGEIPWIDDEPLLEDPKATTITFASDFIQNPKEKNKGLLYCHVNDSFIRAYEINAKELKKYLDKKVEFAITPN